DGRTAGRTIAVNWNAWRDVGMAAAAERSQSGAVLPYMPSKSPAWDGYTDLPGGRLYVRDLSAAKDWIVADHKVKDGNTLLSGTTMLEMARAAVADLYPDTHIRLSNLTFLAPFVVAKDATHRLSLHAVTVGPGRVEMTIRDGSNLDTPPLVVCDAAIFESATPAPLALNDIAARCQVETWVSPDGFLDQDFMAFGPRWANMSRVSIGADEALVELRLPDAFADDLVAHGLHPALLDMATGGAQRLIPGVDLNTEFYVPLSYDSVRIYGEMPARVFSHVRCLPGSGDGLAYFNVTLADASGKICAEVTRYTMKLLAADEAFASGGPQPLISAVSPQNEALEVLLQQGIQPHEGVEAFARIMSQTGLVQTIASSVDPDVWLRQLDASAQDGNTEIDGESNYERPQLASDYQAPETAVEIDLAATWSDLLGVRKVGTRDDFFDLGGNSLVGVRLFAAIRKKHGLSLPLATLFETPTIAELAALMARRGVGDGPAGEGAGLIDSTSSEWSPLVVINEGLPGLRGVFMIHGAQGNVMGFKPLTDLFPSKRPVYGIEAYGADGLLEPLASIPEMARRYIKAMRAVQPHGPYSMAGYSGGGVIAYEMALQLKASGEATDVLVLLDSFHPQACTADGSLFERLKQVPRLHPSIALATLLVKLKKLPVLGKLLSNWSSPLHPETDLESAGHRVYEAYIQGQSKYYPDNYDGQVVIVRALRTNLRYLRLGPSLGWQDQLETPPIVIDVDANHATLFDEPMVSDLAKQLRKILFE
ncbi:hypothetical protein FZX02_03630, partial [Synechococcus sp. MU1644]|nr:hypothetical protein [Synechococcus sp. MU1644]